MAPRPWQRSARTDLRIWGILLAGIAFFATGVMVDPMKNCDAAGDCAPWLVPVAKWLGAGAMLIAAGQLWVNPRRGSRIGPETGDLIWWQRRSLGHAGVGGRIHPSRIGAIRILRRGESADEVHLYDLDGERQFWFDAEVIPWRQEAWARSLAAGWPQIRVEVVD